MNMTESNAPNINRKRMRLLKSYLVEREYARRRALRDPRLFARRYLSHYLIAPEADFHDELYKEMRSLSPGQRRAFAAPRGHAKSTTVTLIFTLWCLYARRKRFIIIVSGTEGQAEMFLNDIRHEIENNAELNADFGDMAGDTWRRDQITTRYGARLAAKGTGSGLRGLRHGYSRPDLIICDDIENDENTATAERRGKVWRWFSRAMVNTLDPSGAVWIIGTILHHDSLLSNLVNGSEERGIAKWPGKIWRALDNKDQPLWPDVWPREKLLARKKEIGSVAFAQEFQNSPAGPEDAVFRPEWLNDPKVWYDDAPECLDYFQAVDPAISLSDKADYFVLLTLGLHKRSGDLYVVEIIRSRLSFDEQVRVIIDSASRWNPVRVGIEAVAYQAGLADAVAARTPLPLARIQANCDKFMRAQRLSAVVENGKVKLRRGDRRAGVLRDELLEFPHGAHDDCVDALAYAVELAAGGNQPKVWMV